MQSRVPPKKNLRLNKSLLASPSVPGFLSGSSWEGVGGGGKQATPPHIPSPSASQVGATGSRSVSLSTTAYHNWPPGKWLTQAIL